ncbi:hypothetical protein VFPPC_17559 [Pochonia chlamydosporia 170]|uniref:Uncharacterized protein n=1 Tax=Pochonia chlamydosporia 170 TaxID=1380566 RepID=A0A219AR64_METCM|nr:hypothetical protein VFPPC_17559 [Pochonia chlamydosporia 170]OWT43278.1 hypothetical protein VFPPC_17559 [Pochonia chlamydosporia 170]
MRTVLCCLQPCQKQVRTCVKIALYKRPQTDLHMTQVESLKTASWALAMPQLFHQPSSAVLRRTWVRQFNPLCCLLQGEVLKLDDH